MADRSFTQFRYALEKKVVDLWAEITIGSTGAPTLVSGKCKGIKSIARNAAGTYTITFQDAYQRVLGVRGTFMVASGVPAAPHISLDSRTTTTAKFLTCAASGTDGALEATDPASGETLLLRVTLSDSTAL